MGIPSLTEHLAGRGHWQDYGLLRTHLGFIFGTLWGSVQADRSLVSSGPAGDSGLGYCGDHFRLMGVWSPQDLQGIVPLKEKVSKIGEKVSVCVCCGVCLSSEDPGLSGLYVEGHGLSQFLWYRTVSSVVFWCVVSIFPSMAYWGDCPFPSIKGSVCTWLLSCELTDHVPVGLFLGSLISVPISVPILHILWCL